MDQTEMPGSYNLYYNLFVGFSLNQPTATDTITGYESQLGSMFKKDIAGSLLRVDANAVIGDDGRSSRIHFKLLGGEFQNGREGRSFGNAQHFKRQLWIRSQGDFESYFSTATHFQYFIKSLNKTQNAESSPDE